MMNDKKTEEQANDFVKQDTDYMGNFRQKVIQFMEQKNITINQLAEMSDLSVDTLKSFLYKDSKDCRLGTAVSLARAMRISIDRLLDAGTIKPVVAECLEIVDRLPQNEYYFLVWYIKRLGKFYESVPSPLPSYISVMTPQCTGGKLVWSNEWTRKNIEHCSQDTRLKCFMGLTIPCVHYMPSYNNGDILLLAHDRNPLNGEHCVIEMNHNIYIARCINKGEQLYFHSIVNADVRVCQTDINKVMGYIADVIREPYDGQKSFVNSTNVN